MTTNNSKDKQRESKNIKKAKLDREEYGFGYDISVNNLDTLGQKEAAKTNVKKKANHPVNNDKK